jgi:hypothetical protein
MLSLPNDNKDQDCPRHLPKQNSWAVSLKLLNTTIQGLTKISPAQLTWRVGNLSKGANVSDAQGTMGVITEIKPHVISVITTSISGGESVASGVQPTHQQLTGRDLPAQHPISAITGLTSALEGKADLDDGQIVTDQIPLEWIISNVTINEQSITRQIVAAENISAYRFVAVNDNQQIVRAGRDYPHAVGFITTAVSASDTAKVYLSGIFTRQLWNFNVNKPLFLSESGEPVQSSVQSIIVYVGTVIDPHTFVMRISIPTLIL